MTTPTPAYRGEAGRARRARKGLRELRLEVPDPRLQQVRARIAAQVACLNPADEQEALDFIESVAEFDTSPNPKP